jgi:hemin uptake protein HemP
VLLDDTNENGYRLRAVHDQPLFPDRSAAETSATASAAGIPRRVRSEDLLRGAVELRIEHQGREYRLRVTQNGKLILTA